ncbi:hypothetical protein FNV43_RR02085 [Rhamnella rubrinervis]|uniref:Uncharacterized protein n=1 Tax=Rhamnella rubrinervis TaxID=2594499 RepID=A0A8K0HQU3_9ROSA|nr:hypothetical protein FNV43_RR02085 [Rhamnella rubrinervis]
MNKHSSFPLPSALCMIEGCFDTDSVLVGRGKVSSNRDVTRILGAFNAPALIHHLGRLFTEIEEFSNLDALGYSPSTPTRSPDSEFSSNSSMPPNAAAGAGRSDFPLVLTPLAQHFPSPDLKTELDDLSWINIGTPVHRGQIILSYSEVEVEGEGIEAGSTVPAEGETDDVVVVDIPASNFPDLKDYELKDLLSTIFEAEVERLRYFCEIPYSVTFRMPEKREWPLQRREGEIAVHSASLEVGLSFLMPAVIRSKFKILEKVSAGHPLATEEVDPSVVDAIKNIKAGKHPASELTTEGTLLNRGGWPAALANQQHHPSP